MQNLCKNQQKLRNTQKYAKIMVFGEVFFAPPEQADDLCSGSMQKETPCKIRIKVQLGKRANWVRAVNIIGLLGLAGGR